MNSDAYSQWHETAWQPRAAGARINYEEDQSYFSHAENRDYGERDALVRKTAVAVYGVHPFLPLVGGRARQGVRHDRTRSPIARREYFPGRDQYNRTGGWEYRVVGHRESHSHREARRTDPAPREEQWDWNEDEWEHSNEHYRDDYWPGQ